MGIYNFGVHMLDWKVLASAIIALLVVSFILLEGFGATTFFSGTISSIGEWFGSSPFGSIVPGSEGRRVTIRLYPENLTLEPEGEVEISTKTSTFTGFKGSINMNLEDRVMTLSEEGSTFRAMIPSSNVTISGFRLSRLSLEEAKFDIEPDITTENGTINIRDFVGTCVTKADALELEGNVSALAGKASGSLLWTDRLGENLAVAIEPRGGLRAFLFQYTASEELVAEVTESLASTSVTHPVRWQLTAQQKGRLLSETPTLPAYLEPTRFETWLGGRLAVRMVGRWELEGQGTAGLVRYGPDEWKVLNRNGAEGSLGPLTGLVHSPSPSRRRSSSVRRRRTSCRRSEPALARSASR